MAKTQGDGEDERWLAGLRGGPSDRDGDQPRRALAPDPWLDGPFPSASAPAPEPAAEPGADPAVAASDTPEPRTPDAPAAAEPNTPSAPSAPAAPEPSAAVAPSGSASNAPHGFGAPDPWAAAAPMPTYEPKQPPAAMPQVPPASEPLPIPRLDDPWAPRTAPSVNPVGYEIPRLAQQGESAASATSASQFGHRSGGEHPAQQPVQPQPAQQVPRQPAHEAAAQPAQQPTRQSTQPPVQYPAQQQPTPQYAQPQPSSPQPSPPSEPPVGAQPTYPQQPEQQHSGQQYAQQPGAFQHPGAPTSGAFAVPQQDGGGVPAQFGGTATQPPSIMPLDLSDSALVRQRKVEPDSGWRKAVYRASFGGINPGISREQTEKNALIERIRTPIRGCHKIAVVSLKGGIGKTTTTSCLGLTLAHYRGDRVVALDANPDAGTLAERLTGVTDVSVRDMLDNIESIDSFTDISRYMSLASRLQVLASDQDAEVSEAFDSQQYRKITGLLARYYNVVLTDSGTGMLHSAMQGTLEEANSLVVVGAPSVDGSSRAAKTLDWLVAHGYSDLVAGSVAVISSVREKSDAVDMDVLRNHFGARCRSVIEIPYDPHLVIGGRIDMAQIRPQTEHAYLELAATVADGFGRRG